MEMANMIRCAIVGSLMAALCVLAGLAGVLLTLAAGVIALISLPHQAPAESGQPDFRSFFLWFVCTGSFAACVVGFIPMTELPAFTMGLLLFSPLFGTMSHLIASAIMSMKPK
jgi:hypothetical protein